MRALLIGMLCLLTACASRPQRWVNQVHPEYGQMEFDKDRYECGQENTGQYTGVAGAYGASRPGVNVNMAILCLKSRGWYPDQQ